MEPFRPSLDHAFAFSGELSKVGCEDGRGYDCSGHVRFWDCVEQGAEKGEEG